jgi:type IV pilus assembly protein PilN
MIRVNLLAVDRERARRRPRLLVAQKVTAACGLLLAATVVGLGTWYWSLGQRSATLDAEIQAAQQEAERLRSIIQQVQQFDERRAQLQQRVALIEQLRKGQTGPVHLLDEVSRSLPETLWLLEMKQVGQDLTLDGRCTTLTALSDFVAALNGSGYFSKGVEIVTSQVEVSTVQAMPDLIRFTVRAKFSVPEKTVSKPLAWLIVPEADT